MSGRLSIAVSAAVAFFLHAAPSEAQVYKYETKDGTVAYTDSLAKLPPKRRAYYNKLEQEQQARLQKIEKSRGKSEVDRERMEEEKKRILAEKLQEEERRRRLEAIDVQLKAIRERRSAQSETETAWRSRIQDTKKALADALAAFDRERETYSAIAIKGGYGLLPGQHEQMVEAKKKMDALEAEIDRLNHELTVVIPEQARRASVPPGWLR